jgi:hypothetical protein
LSWAYLRGERALDQHAAQELVDALLAVRETGPNVGRQPVDLAFEVAAADRDRRVLDEHRIGRRRHGRALRVRVAKCEAADQKARGGEAAEV